MNPKLELTKDTPILPPRYCLYRRVSHPDQVEKDLSLPEQGSQQRAHVARKGGVIVADFEDAGITAAEMRNRPDFLAMIELAKKGGFDVLLIHKSDRSFRNRFEAVTTKVMLRNLGLRLESVTEPWFGGSDPDDQLLEGIMECVSEWYIGNLSKEVKKGLRSAAGNQGRQQGPPPYGYAWASPGTRGAGWVVDEAAATWVRWMFGKVADGAIITEICRELNLMRIVPPIGRKAAPVAGWYRQVVHYMLRNRVYLGRVKIGDEEFAGAHPAIIDDALFACVQATLASRGYGRSERSDALFSGRLLRCPHCGTVLSHQRDRPLADGRRKSRYSCNVGRFELDAIRTSHPGAPAQAHSFTIYEEIVLRHLRSAFGTAKPASAEEVARSMERAADHRSQNATRDAAVDAARRMLEAFPARRENLRWQQEVDVITGQQLLQALANMEEERKKLEEVIRSAEVSRPQASQMEIAVIVHALDAEGLTPRQRRDILRAFIDYITPCADKQGIDVAFRG